MTELLWFLAGIIFGGIFGVVCDRLYQRYESRVCIDAVVGFRMGQNNAVLVTMTNKGKQPIPPCELFLRGEGRGERLGTMCIFQRKEQPDSTAGWLPSQTQEFSCSLDFRFGPVGGGPIFQMLYNHREETDVTLQLGLLNSDVILWEDHKLGQTLLQLLAAAFEEKGVPKRIFYPMHSTRTGFVVVLKEAIVEAYQRYKAFCDSFPKT